MRTLPRTEQKDKTIMWTAQPARVRRSQPALVRGWKQEIREAHGQLSVVITENPGLGCLDDGNYFQLISWKNYSLRTVNTILS